MEDLIFSYNWNNKLSCDIFTTLRLHNPKRFQTGKNFKILLKQKQELQHIAPAKVVAVYSCRLDNLSEHACYLDTGYSKQETINIVNNMYKNIPGFSLEKSVFDLVLLRKIKQ